MNRPFHSRTYHLFKLCKVRKVQCKKNPKDKVGGRDNCKTVYNSAGCQRTLIVEAITGLKGACQKATDN